MTKNRKRIKKVLMFAGLIGGPAFFILFFAYGAKHHFTSLPYFGPKTVVNGDTVYYKIPPFSFTDHLGNEVSNETLKGKIILLTTAMESCPQDCPMQINQVYKYIYEKIEASGETRDIVLITHVVSNDSVQPDARFVIDDLPYEHGRDINFDRWKFVYGDDNPT